MELVWLHVYMSYSIQMAGALFSAFVAGQLFLLTGCFNMIFLIKCVSVCVCVCVCVCVGGCGCVCGLVAVPQVR